MVLHSIATSEYQTLPCLQQIRGRQAKNQDPSVCKPFSRPKSFFKSPLAVQVTASPHTFCLTRSPLSTAVSSSPPAVWVCLKMGYPGTPFHPEVHQLPSGWFSYSKTPCLDVGIYRWLHPCGVGQPLHVGHWAIGPWSSSHQSLLSQTR